MKIKTSITLDAELIKDIDREFGAKRNMSQFVEEAVREYVERRVRKKRDRSDLDILNGKAEKLNKEAEDILAYQADL